jgi:hypothetical protein
MALSETQAAQVLVQALAKAQSRGVYELHESALIHEALTLLGSKLGLVAEQVPAAVSDTQPPTAEAAP